MSYIHEIQRKGIHQLSLAIPIGYWYLPETLFYQLIIPIAAIFISVDIARFKHPWFKRQFYRFFGSIIRQHEKNRFTGSSFLFFSVFITIYLFPKNIAVLSLLFLIICDTIAALVGIKFGRHKIFTKSLEGSLGFLISALLIAYLFKPVGFYAGSIGAVTAAVVELLPLKIDDNFTIPIISSAVMIIFI
ncbi:diacylglycerol/polyprenol kinase family protein [candidate division KSB1 bacterium]